MVAIFVLGTTPYYVWDGGGCSMCAHRALYVGLSFGASLSHRPLPVTALSEHTLPLERQQRVFQELLIDSDIPW